MIRIIRAIRIIRIIFAAVIAAVVIFFAFNFLPHKKQSLRYGLTFSQKFSEELGLDWKQNYIAILDDLGARDLRLAAYWDKIEPEEGRFEFGDLDWQVAESERRGAKIVLVIGRKVPRWPECHIPAWALKLWTSDVDSSTIDIGRLKLLNYIKTTIEHYRDNPGIIAWQVENEPLFPFGECGPPAGGRLSLLNKEIELVRALDSRPIILTDSGELGFAWPYLAVKSDIFGTTLYRYVNHRFFGDIRYSLIPASYFRIKAWWAKKVWGREILISELQAEPWASESLAKVPLERQYKTMNPEIFKEVIDYAERSGFPKAYLWGAEWWYWLKIKHNKPEMWELVKSKFKNQNAK